MGIKKTYYEELKKIIKMFKAEVHALRQTKGKLKVSETRYRQLIETMNEGLAVTDKDMLLTLMNKRFFMMLGYSYQELMGHRLSDFIHEDFQHVIKNQHNRRKKSEIAPYELAWKKKGVRNYAGIPTLAI